jgi:hypothetical protein
MPNSEIDTKLDEILTGEEPVVVEGDDPSTVVEGDNPSTVVEENPPGYLTYEEWVDQGKDPDLYKGKKAYEQEYDRIQDNKRLDREAKDTKTMLRQLVEHQEEQRTKDIEQGRLQAVRDLQEAKDNDDVDAALEAVDRIKSMDTAPVEKPRHAKVTELIDKTPMVNREDSGFNAEFAADFGAIYDGLINKLTQNGTYQASDTQVEKAWNAAFKDAKGLNEALFESPRRSRTTNNSTNNRQTATTSGVKVGDIKLKDPRNPANVNAVADVAKALGDKFGDKFDPDKFAKAIVGE